MPQEQRVDTYNVARNVTLELELGPNDINHLTVVGLMDEVTHDITQTILEERLGRELGKRVADRIMELTV